MRRLTVCLVFIILLILPSVAEANWQVFTYDAGAYAALSMTLPTQDEQHAMLTIDFSARHNCATAVGLMIFNGSSLGQPIAKERVASNSMSIEIAGQRWVGGLIKVTYNNGFEVLMSAGEDIIDALKRRDEIHAQVGSGTIYVFPSSQNIDAIEAARQTCWTMR